MTDLMVFILMGVVVLTAIVALLIIRSRTRGGKQVIENFYEKPELRSRRATAKKKR